MLIPLSVSSRANIIHVVEEVIISRVNLTYTRKGNSNYREAKEYSFILVFNNISLYLFNIIYYNNIITSKVKAKGNKGIII